MHIIELSFFPIYIQFLHGIHEKKRLMRFFMLRETTNIEKFYNLPYLIIIFLILSVEKSYCVTLSILFLVLCEGDISLSRLY